MIDWLSELEFAHPSWLLAALSALPVVYWSVRGGGRIVFSSVAVLPASRSWRARLAWLPTALLALAALSMSVALAGPRIPDRSSRVRHEGIAIMMVVDTSGSMRALDLSDDDQELTRLDAVKRVFRDFVLGAGGLSGRPDDAIGVVSFARYSDGRCPLTLDHGTVAGVAAGLEIVTDRNEDGTALGDALGLAVERLRKSKAESRVIIALTDGVNNAGDLDPLAAAELAHTKGVKIYTIGAGTNGLAPVRVEDGFGRSALRAMPVEIDEATLRAIADRTGAEYFRATDGDALRAVYERIDKLERTELVEQRYREYHELYVYALAAGMVLAALAWLGVGSVFRRLP